MLPYVIYGPVIASELSPLKDIAWWVWIVWPGYALFKSWLNKRIKEAQEEQAAKDAIDIKKMQELLERQARSMQEANNHYQLIIAKTAVGSLAMKEAGNYTEENMKEFMQYVSGVATSLFPDKVKAKISQLKDNPPTFEQAVAEVKRLPDSVARESFIEDIKMAGSNDDGVWPESINRLIERWEREVVKH